MYDPLIQPRADAAYLARELAERFELTDKL